ncbi:ANK-REP-REGION domain-containing protein [Mycena venus]|uniref:ANK-REP-REGION domain-containing protein n=1 Tax=Mycena venus TaxID=2733690 RepID=A0A8H6XSM0_9AGAR|nr:ANK-REP-REGION domain-containing protein [Mycena venus]
MSHSHIIGALHNSAQDHNNQHDQIISALRNTSEDQRIGNNDLSKSVWEMARNQEQSHNSAERRQIIEWVSPLNFFPRQADILKARQPGTGEWLLRKDMFVKWKAGEMSAMWCRGMPGAGKTVLVSIVVDHLRANLPNENSGVAVLYLDHKATETHSPTNLLAAIWRQLIPGKPISPLVHGLYRTHSEQCTRPSFEEAYSALESTIVEFSCVFIVVDALDEYPEDYRNTLLGNLSKLGPPVRLMLTSRPHISVDHVIPNIEVLDVRAAEEDIRKYLEGQILRSSRLSKHINKSSNLRDSLEEKIVKRSDGMFLLAKLHIDSIATKQNVTAVRDALNDLPSDLDGTYDEIVHRINQQSADDRQLAWRTVSWVLNAKKPLRPSQLKEALAVEPGTAELDPDRQTDMDIILSVCAGLVVVDEVEDKIRLIHYTTQIYFQSAHVQNHIFFHAQSEITLTCMTYMSLTFKESTHMLQLPFLLFTQHPFLHYTVDYCLVHARGAPETLIKHDIMSFLRNCSVWWRLWNWKNGGRQSAPEKLRIALAFHLDEICKHIIEEDGIGVILQEAVTRGDADEVRVLVHNGVDLEKDGHALQEAVIHSHEEIVEILLVHDKNRQGRTNTILQDRGNKESDDNKCIAETHNHYGAALYGAAEIGNEAIVKMLLMHGAGTNVEGGKYGTPLQAALREGHEKVARLLIQHGADVNANGGVYGSALLAAVCNQQQWAVHLLLEHGANANGEGGAYGTLLQAALWNGQEGAARLLIAHGADVNANGGVCGTVLQAAALEGDEAAVRLLIEHGADVNAEGGEYGSTLCEASSRGHTEIVQLLLDHGANVNAREPALPVAAAAGHTSIVRLLIEHGADVNVESRRFGTAFQAASFRGHWDIAGLLLEYGAEGRQLSDEDMSQIMGY